MNYPTQNLPREKHAEKIPFAQTAELAVFVVAQTFDAGVTRC